MDNLKVALVHDWLTAMRGGEKVLESFCDLFPQAPIFSLLYNPGTISEKISSHKSQFILVLIARLFRNNDI